MQSADILQALLVRTGHRHRNSLCGDCGRRADVERDRFPPCRVIVFQLGQLTVHLFLRTEEGLIELMGTGLASCIEPIAVGGDHGSDHLFGDLFIGTLIGERQLVVVGRLFPVNAFDIQVFPNRLQGILVLGENLLQPVFFQCDASDRVTFNEVEMPPAITVDTGILFASTGLLRDHDLCLSHVHRPRVQVRQASQTTPDDQPQGQPLPDRDREPHDVDRPALLGVSLLRSTIPQRSKVDLGF